MSEPTKAKGRPAVVEAAKALIASGKYSYKQYRGKGWETDFYVDCSEFVYQAYKAANMPIPILQSHQMAQTFPEVDDPEPGDVVYWEHGHVGIVEDPELGTFLNAASTKSGLRRESYKQGWRASQSGRTFHRPPVK